MKQKTQEIENAIAGYDLTIPADKWNKTQITDFMWKYCKKWCFQLEKGSEETEYEHYQCRISLISKKRWGTMKKFIQENLHGSHCTPTYNQTFQDGNDMYVMKEDTRIAGPWSDKTEVNENTIPKRFRGEITWNPFQAKIRRLNDREADDRHINLLHCPDGNKGKSFLVGWECTHKLANKIPAQETARDIMRCILKQPKRKVYYIDLPRANSDKMQNAIYSAIEELKNGYAFDDRYDWNEEWFEPPHVWVFTNQPPPFNLLSRDRWILWHITEQGELIRGPDPNGVPHSRPEGRKKRR